MSNYRNYYDSTFGRPRLDSTSKKAPEKPITSRIATKYGGSYTSGLSSTTPSASRLDNSRLKPTIERDRCHPPISYKSPLSRGNTTRSRDPSPADRSEKSTTTSTSGYLNPNRLYPRPYTRSISRENTLSPASSTSSLPKFTGSRNDSAKFSSPTTSKFGSKSSSSTPKEDSLSSKYNSASSRNVSKEDLSSGGSQKYLNSRFLPKNSVVKSFTAYTRPSTVRTNEASRKNRELLSVIQAEKEQERLSRPTSRCSSLAPEEVPKTRPSVSPEPLALDPPKELTLETLTVVTRSTSPTLGETKTSFLRSRRIEIAKTTQKEITRPRTDPNKMIDKAIQSDRLDDTTRSSRFVGASRITAAPWSSFLDMKFSSPNSKKGTLNKQDSCESPKSLSRTSSTKSIVSSKSDKEAKKTTGLPKSKITPPKQLTDKKQLPPPIPKNESSNKQSSLHSLNSPNKDFRKSVLNMNLDGSSKKKLGRRSTSASSVESDVADPDATDVSENLTTCNSFVKSNSVSKLPQKILHTRRSPSTDVSTGVSSSEDDFRTKKEKFKSTNSSRTSLALSATDEISPELKPQSPKSKTDPNRGDAEAKSFFMRALAPVTNLFKNNRQSQAVENFVEPSQDQISESGDCHEKVVWILDPSSSNPTSDRSSFSQLQSIQSEPKQAKIILHRVESSGNKAGWADTSQTASSSELSNLQQTSEPANMKYADAQLPSNTDNECQLSISMQNFQITDLNTNNSKETWWMKQAKLESNEKSALDAKFLQPKIHLVESGEKPWWLDDSAEVPEGVETYSDRSQTNYNLENQQQARKKFTIPHVESGEKPWWLDETSEVPEGVQTYPDWKPEQEVPSKKSLIKHIDSGEPPWWLENSNDSPECHTNTYAESIPDNRYQQSSDNVDSSQKMEPKIRPVDSGEIPWWLQENATPPDGVEVYRNCAPQEEKRVSYKRNDSGNSTWWADSDKSNSESKPLGPENIMEPEYQERYKIRHIDSGERAWWMNSNEHISDTVDQESQQRQPKYNMPSQNSEEKDWWLQNSEHAQQSENESELEAPLGDRASPEGLEMPKEEGERLSPYENVPNTYRSSRKGVFISKHTNIDDILGGGGQMWSPMMDKLLGYSQSELEPCLEVSANQVIIHEGTGNSGTISENRRHHLETSSSPYKKLDDAALQLYKDGDYGSYLDLEASISEQQEEFEGFQSNKKNSIVLRTQLSVRVHTIIEKLLTAEGRELRRALFSLKQIFQEDKDLVHEFVQNDGLSCLIKVGSEADQNYQNYILRALGQVMLYVDGMNGVMEHNQTIQWFYSLISSKFRLVVKTALKLLLVFVEYTDSNCMLLVKAVNTVEYSQGLLPYHNIMRLLKDFDSADTELLIYATTLINKVLNGVPDQDIYYDQVDALEEQGMEAVIQRYMSKPGTDLDLLQQFQIYEAVLQYEDGEERGGCTPFRHLDESIRKTIRSRKSMNETSERRKSRRYSTGNNPSYGGLNQRNNNLNNNNSLYCNQEDFDESSSSQSSGVNNASLNGGYKESNKANEAGVTPALKRRRERAERQRSFMREQAESAALLKGYQNNKQTNNIHQLNNNNEENENNINGTYTNALQQRLANGNNILNRNSSRKDMTPYFNAVNKQLDSEDTHKQPWIMSCLQNQEKMEESDVTNENERNLVMQLKKENTVKDLTQKLANQSILQSPVEENKISRFGDMSGLISKAKEGLAKSKSKADVLKSPTSENLPKIEIKKSENELRWEELVSSFNRPLNLCDMDFTDLGSDDEVDILAPVVVANGVPPPPPPLQDMGNAPPPPPLANSRILAPPPVPSMPLFGVSLQRNTSKSSETKIPVKKNKKTVKLFWKEVRDDPVVSVKLKSGFIWDELTPVTIDTQKLEHLFESRAKDLISKKQQELNKNKEIIVLDHKRSNAINIGMTKLPPPRSIKTAILKMDSTIMNREGIEKLLTMLPTEEERTKIQEAQAANPDLPLGSAEQFLLTLASISELPARLKLWAFKLDFENSEKEIAEPLMDLKQGFTLLKSNKTFKAILSTLLSVGNFLNGNEVKGFQIDYLTKVPEVKDTVHKHSLLHHLCHIVMEKFPDATDLYSEIGAITRASKVDFDELALNIQRLEADCKASWDHLKLIAKHDGSTMMKVKMSDFLADCAERIILLGIIYRRIINRFHKFLLWLGIPFHQVGDTKPNEFCRVVSEFALEYRTTRERVLQQLEKKANHRERNKTRGKMITDVGKFRSKEDRADAELRQLLGSDMSDVESMQGTLPWRHRRKEGASTGRLFGANSPNVNGNLTDGDDEILESLVKTATKGPRTAPRERKRTRHADRKSLRRTLKNGLSEEEKKILSGYIKAY